MSLLNITADGLPNVLVVLHACTLRAGQRSLSRDTLLETVAPSAVVDDEGAMARSTLNSWVDAGLFRLQDGMVVTEPFPGGVRSASTLQLRDFTRRCATGVALSPQANPDLWGTKGAADLTRALAWMLLQDAYRCGFADFEALEAQQISDDARRPFRNTTRVQGLRFWSRFMGFSREPYADIDPTLALRDALDQIILPGQTLGADAFIDQVARVLPVLDRGHWQAQVLAIVSTPPPHLRNPGQVSPALSRALLNLRASRELLLQTSSDSGSFMVLTGAQGARVDLTFHQVSRPNGGSR